MPRSRTRGDFRYVDFVPALRLRSPGLVPVLNALEDCRAVTIAEIQGGVYGGGTDLALACDFRLGTDAVEMFMPAARLGGSARWDGGVFSAGAEFRHAFRQSHVGENERAAEAYDLLNLSAGANVVSGGRVHSLSLRVDNVLDQRYREATSRIKDFALNPGIDLSLVYRIQF